MPKCSYVAGDGACDTILRGVTCRMPGFSDIKKVQCMPDDITSTYPLEKGLSGTGQLFPRG